MRVYVASSWRNVRQPTVVAALRGAGHDVYDFHDPASSFNWRECSTAEQLRNPCRFRDEVLTSYEARYAFASDMGALRRAEATVLVLPCGRSAHLELGWATGAGQRTVVLLDDPVSEPELMYLMNGSLCVSVDEVVSALLGESMRRPGMAPVEYPMTTIVTVDERLALEAVAAVAREVTAANGPVHDAGPLRRKLQQALLHLDRVRVREQHLPLPLHLR